MAEFVSEQITPGAGTFQSGPMATGLPGLPRWFTWRGERHTISAVLGAWKASGPEIGRVHGERYLRRHYFRLGMESGQVWTIYFVRHTPPGGAARRRWFLYSLDPG
jgi:hypothetical protein